MSTPPDRRSRKRLATRLDISNVATRLFLARGFDKVTVDEIAEAADVGRMTVFNHFPRKEDLFFDRDEEGRALVRDAVRARAPGVAPLEALRQLAHRLIAEKSPAVEFSARSQSFVTAIEGSESLKARARQIRDEFARLVAQELCDATGRAQGDGDAQLAANLLLATWTVAFVQAHQAFRQTGDTAQAQTVFLTAVDKGAAGLQAAVVGTPYV